MIRDDSKLIGALFAGRTVKHAAEIAKVSERTVARRLNDPEFQEKLNKASADLLAFSLAPLPRLLDGAVRTLGESLGSKDEKTRLRAAEIVFNQAFRFLTAIDYDQRLRRQEDLADAIIANKKP